MSNKIKIYGQLESGVAGGHVTDSGQVCTSEAITIAGGPLANDIAETNEAWPEDWKDADGNKIIPAGKSLNEVLSTLFLKENEGTVSWEAVNWNPTMKAPSVSLDKSGTVEVGTVATVTANTTSGVNNNTRSSVLSWSPSANGYFINGAWTKEPKTESKAGNAPTGTLSVATSLKIGSAAGTITNNKFTVGEGTNTVTATQTGYSVTCEKLPATTVYASTNTKKMLSNKAATLNDTAATSKTLAATTATASVTGSRFMFWGAYAEQVELTSANIRALANGGSAAVAATSKDITMTETGVKHFIVAVPSGYTLSSAKNATSMNNEEVGNFTKTEVMVEGLNGFAAAKYNVYSFVSGTAWKGTGTAYNVTIKKG